MRPKSSFAFWSVIGLLLLCTLAGLLWRFTPLYHHLDLNVLIEQAAALQGNAWAPLVIMAVFMAGGMVLFFHAVLLWTTVFIFDPWHAFLYCELGTLASAVTMYGMGRIVRPDIVERIAGSYLDKVTKALAKKGKLTLMVLHWFPICPFSILNFISGATHIRFGDFLIGTLVGCTPGILLLVFFGHQIIHTLRNHHWINMAPLAVVIVGLLVIGRYARERLRKFKRII